jgi:predicted ATPase
MAVAAMEAGSGALAAAKEVARVGARAGVARVVVRQVGGMKEVAATVAGALGLAMVEDSRRWERAAEAEAARAAVEGLVEARAVAVMEAETVVVAKVVVAMAVVKEAVAATVSRSPPVAAG